jgi:hypothetical protein
LPFAFFFSSSFFFFSSSFCFLRSSALLSVFFLAGAGDDESLAAVFFFSSFGDVCSFSFSTFFLPAFSVAFLSVDFLSSFFGRGGGGLIRMNALGLGLS